MNPDNESCSTHDDGPQIECTPVPPVPKEREFLLRLSESDLRTLRGIAWFEQTVPDAIAKQGFSDMRHVDMVSLLKRLNAATTRALKS